MLQLLETISGTVILFAYMAVAVVLPSAVVIAFISFIGTLLRIVIDPIVGRLPEPVRSQPTLATYGRRARRVVISAIGAALFLALVGASSQEPAEGLLARGLAQTIVTLTAIQDIVATAFTGRVLNDMLLELQPTAGEPPWKSLELLGTLTAVHLDEVLDPGVTGLAFRWTFAAFTSSVVAIYVVFEPLRAVRRRVAVLIAPAPRETVLTQESLERQAEMIAQALAKATPGATAAPAVAAQPVSRWARAGAARPAVAPTAAAAPGAIASPRVAVVTWDGELAAALERQLDSAGFAPLAMRSVAEAFASRVWPQVVFIDARHLQWLSPDRLPLLVRARLIAVTRDDIRVPRGWQLDTHAVESGADALLDLLRRRDARRRAGTREPGA